MKTYTEAELALIAAGPHTLEAFPDDFVIHRTEKRVFTPANIGGGNVLARCPDGQERWLSPTDFGKLAHFIENPEARQAAMPKLLPRSPKTLPPRERLEGTMNQARAWSVDSTLPVSVRRKLARSVQAYDQAQADRALAPRIAQLEAQVAAQLGPKPLTPRQRERAQRAEWDRQTAAHQERMRTDRAYRKQCDPHGWGTY